MHIGSSSYLVLSETFVGTLMAYYYLLFPVLAIAIPFKCPRMSTPNGIQIGVPKSFLPTIQGINATSFVDDGERSKILLAAYALVSRLETPWETVCRLAMAQVKCILVQAVSGFATDPVI